jgi:excisionase family DNA binding protein
MDDFGPVVFAGGKWLVGGLVAYFHREHQRLRQTNPGLPPGLPPHCLDPLQIARFLGVSVEELDWPGGELSQVAASLRRVEEKLTEALRRQTGPEIDQRYLSIRQAATHTGLSYSHVRRAVLSGELPASNVGSASHPVYRIDRGELANWLEKKKGGSRLPPKSTLKELVKRHLPDL